MSIAIYTEVEQQGGGGGLTDQLFRTAEPPNPLLRDHTGYFGPPSLPAPFLDWAAAGADHTSYFGPPGDGGDQTSYFGPPEM